MLKIGVQIDPSLVALHAPESGTILALHNPRRLEKVYAPFETFKVMQGSQNAGGSFPSATDHLFLGSVSLF